MTEQMDGQMTLFDPDIWSGKTSPEHSAQTKERTSVSSSKKPQRSQTPKFLYLDLRRENGLMQESLWEEGTASLGGYSMLNISECPSVAVESHLSQILEETPHPKYSLSARACQGILNRAERRGKELPPMLKEALIKQAQLSASKNEQDVQGGAKESSSSTIEQERSAPSTINQCCGINGDIAETLDASYYKSCGERQGVERTVVYDARGNGSGDLAPTITGDHQDRVTDYTALCIGNGQMCNMAMKPIANSLDTMHDQQAVITAVDFRNGKENPNTNGTLQSHSHGGSSLNLNNVCRVQSIVRRLTPMECERLQGYPDGWTDIGKWTDSKGKKHKDADSPRYKALGNSIAVPCWRFILERISERTEEHTMASLFDGIGGFPLIWEQINGSKSCRWVSEIEEFPIAVTKIRFEQE